MYLHLGKNVAVLKKDIVAVCDLDNVSYSHITRAYLGSAEKSGHVVNVCDDLPRSVVICKPDEGEQILYLSQVVSTTLQKRMETPGLE